MSASDKASFLLYNLNEEERGREGQRNLWGREKRREEEEEERRNARHSLSLPLFFIFLFLFNHPFAASALRSAPSDESTSHRQCQYRLGYLVERTATRKDRG